MVGIISDTENADASCQRDFETNDNLLSPAKTVLSDYRDLLSVEDLAIIFDVSKQTIYKELKSGKFGKPIQIGRTYKISKIFIVKNFIMD